ncbi:MAG: hypothetical protein AAFX93_03850 [Verrucomicrobiota bacterium]
MFTPIFTPFRGSIVSAICAISLGLLLVSGGCISPGNNSAPVATGASSNAFPGVEGINLLGQIIQIPNQLMGQPVVVIIAFKREQQEVINPWLPPLEELERNTPRFRFYELPVIYEVSMMERFWINNGMRSGIPGETSRSRTITVYTDREKFMQLTGISSADNIHLFVLNANKEIVYRETGAFTPEKFTALSGVVKGMAVQP